MTPNGFDLEHNAVGPEVWQSISHWLSTEMLPLFKDGDQLTSVPIPWETGTQMQNRKIAQFGNCKYDYINDTATAGGEIVPIPRYICNTLLTTDERKQYTQCIINWYSAENEIPWHLDHEYFGETVLVYVFGENRPLMFRKRRTGKNECKESDLETAKTDAADVHTKDFENDDASFVHFLMAYPLHCSRYILKDAARTEWEHSVPKGNAERISITFRSWKGPQGTLRSKTKA